jgi:putative thioredoxin
MVDVTDATFGTAVLDRSQQVPVVVDLWAPWCGPCRTLGPILERVIVDSDGQVELAKVNVDENPQISAMFQVQGIPAVYALHNREIVSQFVGAQPEAQVRKFVDALLPTSAETELAELLHTGDEASLRKALELEPGHERVVIALAELLVDRGEHDEALGLLARIPETAEARRVAALARTAGGAVEDPAARLDALLDRVKDDEAARQEFLDVLELLGPDDPRTPGYRKALTARLF